MYLPKIITFSSYDRYGGTAAASEECFAVIGVTSDVCYDDAGVQTEGAYPLVAHSSVQLGCEQDVGQFRDGIGRAHVIHVALARREVLPPGFAIAWNGRQPAHYFSIRSNRLTRRKHMETAYR